MPTKSDFNEVPIEVLRRLIDYCADTGVLTWKKRRASAEQSQKEANIFNSLFAGKVAGSKMKRGRNEYITVFVLGNHLLAHRVAWAISFGRWPEGSIDHIDGNGLNNRIGNLREAPPTVNGRNARLHKNNTSGHCGVIWNKGRRKWVAQVMIDRKNKNLGGFVNKADAIRARLEANRKLGFTDRHGESATNANDTCR